MTEERRSDQSSAGETRRREIAVLVVVLLVLVGLALAWRYSSLHRLVSVDRLTGIARRLPPSSGLLVTLAGYLVGSLLVLPINLLTLVTVLAFGTWPGTLYAYIGGIAAALLTFWLGRVIGGSRVRRIFGRRAERVRRTVVKGGVPSMAVLRAAPLAPFTIVNLIAGAIGVRFADYLFGSLLGLLPALIALAVLGQHLLVVLRAPTPARIAILVAILVALVALALLAQLLIRRLLSGDRDGFRQSSPRRRDSS